MPTWNRPSASPLLVRRLVLTVAVIALLSFACFKPADRLAQEYVQRGLERALVTFAAARTVNALISVVQETTVAIQPLGMGVTVSPAQILDPLNDLVEQFSALMLAASISFAIQRILISVGGYEWVTVALGVVLLAWAWANWNRSNSPAWLTKALLILLLVRFAVPIAAVGSEISYRLTMSAEYKSSSAAFDLTSHDLRSASEKLRVDPPDVELKDALAIGQKVKGWWTEKRQELKTLFQQLEEKTKSAVRHVVVLMALFIIQTLVLPLLFLWIVQRLFRSALNWSTPLLRPAR